MKKFFGKDEEKKEDLEFWAGIERTEKIHQLNTPLLSDYTPDIGLTEQAQTEKFLRELPHRCDRAMTRVLEDIRDMRKCNTAELREKFPSYTMEQLDNFRKGNLGDICAYAMDKLLESIKAVDNRELEGNAATMVRLRCIFSLERLKEHDLAVKTQAVLGITDDKLGWYYSEKIKQAIDKLLQQATPEQINSIKTLQKDLEEGMQKEKKEGSDKEATPMSMYMLYNEIFDDDPKQAKNLRELHTCIETTYTCWKDTKNNDLKMKILEASTFPPAPEKLQQQAGRTLGK